MKFLTFILLSLSIASGQAALIYSGPRNIPIPTSFSGVSIDLLNLTHFNGEPAADWSNSQVNFFRGGDGIFSGPRLLPFRLGSQPTSTATSLGFGTIIDGTLATGPVGNGVSQGHIGPGPNQFANNEESYLGFQIDLTDTGDFTYGFMRVTLTDGSSPGLIHDWTYSDTPGETVTVGAIPEPATHTFFGLLGITLLSIRRRHPSTRCR